MKNSQPNPWIYRILVGLSFAVLFGALWTLRSWNLDIGDGEFCCKQTIGETAFPNTLTRSFLSYLLYRAMFSTLHPILNWWVEDIIALSSCAAGLLFFAALSWLANQCAKTRSEWCFVVLFPSTSLILQVFCGHIEFYPWMCATLMLSMYFAWRCVHRGDSPLWASAAMALSAGFHSSGVFYFPALLLLPALRNKGAVNRNDWKSIGAFFVLYLATAMLHRQPLYFIAVVIVAVPLYFYAVPLGWQTYFKPWQTVYLPWLILFTLRASLWLKDEPLLEHIAPFGEPYDHGAYLYTFFSWAHLYDKSMFHLWLAPLGLPVLITALAFAYKRIQRDPWMTYLFHLCIWTMAWSIMFYPQLRSRDWDLFASMSIPLNCFVLFALWNFASRRTFQTVMSLAIAAHLCISIPVIIRNSSLLNHRGYVTVSFESKPVQSTAYLRGLELGVTPITQENVRAGEANIRMVPLKRGHGSWSRDLLFEDGESYQFSETLVEVETPPIPEYP